MNFYPVLLFPSHIEQYLRSNKTAKDEKIYSKPSSSQSLSIPKRLIKDKSLLEKTIKFWKYSHIAAVGLIVCLHLVIIIYELSISNFSWTTVALILISFLLIEYIYNLGIEFLNYLISLLDKDNQKLEQIYWRKNANYNQAFINRSKQQSKHNYTLRLNNSFNKTSIKSNLKRGEIKGDAPKGVSEAHLETYLRRFFPTLEIVEDYYQIEDTKLGYTTDFSLVDTKSGFGIDLEVDEPYEGKYKTPHHCTDNKKDRNRNKFLLERGWIVLRVSEYQAVHQPKSVCKLIAQVFKAIGKEHCYNAEVLNFLDLTPDPCWNSIQAKRMITSKYRERYLDKAGIMEFNPDRERKNAQEYKALKAKQKREAKKARRQRKNK